MNDFQGLGKKWSYFIASYRRTHLEECGLWASDNQLYVFCFIYAAEHAEGQAN